MKRHLSFLLVIVMFAAAVPFAAAQEGPEPAAPTSPLKQTQQNWEDFIHYLRIAQLEMAIASGKAFLATDLAPDQLLLVIDEIAPYRDFDRTLERAQKMEGEIAKLASDVQEKIKQARLTLARDEARILKAIESLDDGLRARLNAIERLQAAGEYAAPSLLKVLLGTDDAHRQLQPYVIEAMVAIGRPVVTPLNTALPELPAVTKQQVGEVLGRIGYPQSLPYLKAEIERAELSDQTRRSLQQSFDSIVQRTAAPQFSDAASLFHILGEDYYAKQESLTLNPAEPEQLLWFYQSGPGLTYMLIPTSIYCDVMAMRSARRALQLNSELAPAMSLWIAANFRRENVLAGGDDPSYGDKMQSPHFYATLAGPRHVHPVLHRALAEGNAELALDAINALSSTAGTEALINSLGQAQPLVAALNFPDRRVRFQAAFAIARSTPELKFGGSGRIVPVLSEAIRQGDKKYAVVIASSIEEINAASPIIETGGKFMILPGNTVDNVTAQMNEAPGIDLAIVNTSVGQAQAAVAAARQNVKLAATPIVVLTEAEQVPVLQRQFATVPGVFVADRALPAAEHKGLIEQAIQWPLGAAITEDQSLAFATQSTATLAHLASVNAEAYRAIDSQPALIAALADTRDAVVLGAGSVLALFGDTVSQQALAEAALDTARSADVQVALLRSLAASARVHGNQLTERHTRLVLDRVTQSTGNVADAAAEVHGALNLPTSRAVEGVTGR
jgi:hypothetical protein